MVSPVKVFVSYSWKAEDATMVVDALEAQCKERNIQLVRDNNVLQHGDLIQEFMDKLSGGEHIITVFSDAYFKSKWCMYELLTTLQKGNFKDRTHPIIVDDCDLQDQQYRLGLVQFWMKKYQEAETSLKNYKPGVVLEEYKLLNLYQDIYQKIDELLNFASGRVTLPLKQLKEKHYVQLLNRICPVQTDNKDLSDAEFLKRIKNYLALDLKKSASFRQHVINECGLDFADAVGLHSYLLDQCLKGEFVQIIQNLQSAFVECFDELECEDADVVAVKKLCQTAKDIVSKLVLFNVKNEWMKQYRHVRSQNGNHEHLLPNMSFGSVEVVTSRDAQCIPRFQYGRHDLSLQGAKGVALESGFRSREVVRDVIKRLYHRVMEKEMTGNIDDKYALDNLKRTIRQRKKHKNLKLRKNYFLLMPDESGSALADKTIQDEIKSLLPDLSFIRIKSGEYEEAFIVEDADLMVAISEFYKTLEEYKNQ